MRFTGHNVRLISIKLIKDRKNMDAVEVKNDDQSTSANPVGSVWPGAFGIFKTSKVAVMLNLRTLVKLYMILVGVTLLVIIIGALLFPKNGIGSILIRVISEIIGVGITSATTYVVIQGVRGNKVSPSEAWAKIQPKIIDLVIATILILLISIVSVLLFIIPAFFVLPRIYLTLYFVIDKDMKPIEAIKASWNQTKGHVGKIYGIYGVNVLILLPVLTIIGIIATIYFSIAYYAAAAILYNFIISNKTSVTEPKIN